MSSQSFKGLEYIISTQNTLKALITDFYKYENLYIKEESFSKKRDYEYAMDIIMTKIKKYRLLLDTINKLM